MASVIPRLAPGTTFAERFRILEYVGHGSMGSVYRAEPLEGGASIALKIVNLHATTDPRARRRFEREIDTGSRIKSPYVARTLESGGMADAGWGWISMEFAQGQTLAELLQDRGALDAATATKLLQQLFAALSEAHATGIVHRDLKPENIRVDVDGDDLLLKVLDFGIAKAFGSTTSSGTTPGLGTPLWTAPEQGREGYRPVPNADVWALGLLCFFALTGALYWRHATQGASMADLAMELIKSDIEPATERAAELGLVGALPVGFDAWFARAVHREPDLRFQDAAEAWTALQPLLEKPETGPARPSLVVRPGAFLTLVILSVVAAGLAIYWLLRGMRI